MMFSKIWERYFLKEIFKFVFLFIIAFYGLYAIIDYSYHTSLFHNSQNRLALEKILLYYFCDFTKRAHVLLPFAVLLATVKTLCTLNVNNELVAMLTNGIKLKTLLRPFLFVGLFFTFLIFLSEEYLESMTAKEMSLITGSKIKKGKKPGASSSTVDHVVLEDKSTLIFQNYDLSMQAFHDAYWIRSADDIYRFKYLYPNTGIPEGHLVDHLKRNSEKNFEMVESFATKQFPEMKFNSRLLRGTMIQPEERSLSDLWNIFPKNDKIISDKEAHIVTTFYYKLAMPWLCFFAVLGPIPFCVKCSRTLPVFLIYAGSIFGLVAFYLAMDAFFTLGKRQVLQPFIAIWLPFSIFFLVLGWRHLRIGYAS